MDSGSGITVHAGAGGRGEGSLGDAFLDGVMEKVVDGVRVTEAEAERLYGVDDINALGRIANVVRERKNGYVATWIPNVYVNYSNVCVLSCQFCAFGAKKRDAHAFEHSISEMVAKVEEAVADGAREVHMVGGLHPTLPESWYLELVGALRAISPDLFIKAFTAIEIRHLAKRVFKRSIRETLECLREAGLGALTGGGA